MEGSFSEWKLLVPILVATLFSPVASVDLEIWPNGVVAERGEPAILIDTATERELCQTVRVSFSHLEDGVSASRIRSLRARLHSHCAKDASSRLEAAHQRRRADFLYSVSQSYRMFPPGTFRAVADMHLREITSEVAHETRCDLAAANHEERTVLDEISATLQSTTGRLANGYVEMLISARLNSSIFSVDDAFPGQNSTGIPTQNELRLAEITFRPHVGDHQGMSANVCYQPFQTNNVGFLYRVRHVGAIQDGVYTFAKVPESVLVTVDGRQFYVDAKNNCKRRMTDGLLYCSDASPANGPNSVCDLDTLERCAVEENRMENGNNAIIYPMDQMILVASLNKRFELECYDGAKRHAVQIPDDQSLSFLAIPTGCHLVLEHGSTTAAPLKPAKNGREFATAYALSAKLNAELSARNGKTTPYRELIRVTPNGPLVRVHHLLIVIAALALVSCVLLGLICCLLCTRKIRHDKTISTTPPSDRSLSTDV